MAQQVQGIEVPKLELDRCSVDEHCEAIRASGDLPYWWYQERHGKFGNFSVPFQDSNGNWWYQVRAGLCWPIDCFRPIERGRACPPLSKSWVGVQHIVPSEQEANSRYVINTVLDLASYDETSVNAKRRNAIRKGLRACTLEVSRAFDHETLAQCWLAWHDLTERTGWKRPVAQEEFETTWSKLSGVPGTSVIVGRESDSGQVAGFLIVKIIGDTAYVDTIASRTDLLKANVNDAMMFAFLMNARRIPGVSKSHYAIRSYVASLEKFKTGLGFTPVPFPAYTHLRLPARLGLRWFFPAWYQRIMGRFDDEKGQ